ncbi:pectinesterase-like [Canna indica]|uniref:Pectinesterase n=1 Tax=Canna indica TaxID=4628 RepID=A0AAQ3QT98_9LILI|nr:pectinesterase-like [Canna indica]
MSAFQDFNYLSERRRAERQQRRRRIIAAVSTVSAILVLAVVGAAAVVYNNNETESTTSTSSQLSTSSSSGKGGGGGAPKKDFHTSTAISLICSSTDFKNTCEASLKKHANETSTPKDLVRAAVSILVEEISEAFAKSDTIKSDDPAVKGAVEVCKDLHTYAVGELNGTLSTIDSHNLNQLPRKVHDLSTWLSAVATYQQTCIDGYPEGEFKTKMQNAMNSTKQLTSNALSIVGSISSIVSLVQIGGGRRLLAKEPPEFHKDGLPSWISDDDRRVLLARSAQGFTPNITVAKDGSGDCTTIADALAKIPKKYDGRYVIYVKEGVYEEQLLIEKNMINVTMYGDGSRKTVITGSKNNVDGTKTFYTATFAVAGEGFLGVSIGFQNTAGAIKHQAVALRVQADRAIFLNCRMEGYQDTLYAHSHRQFYRGCLISGTIDFIFGDGSAVFQNCIMTVRRPLDNQQNIVLAQGRTMRTETTAFVIQNCKIVPEDDLKPDVGKIRSYLGRPWQEFSKTVVMESDIGDFISPEGYTPWSGDFGLNTLSYSEYNNKGPSGDSSKRVKWPGVKVLSRDEAITFTATEFIQADDWVPKTGTPVRLGLFGQ